MGKYDHIKVDVIDMKAISAKVVPGGVRPHEWNKLGIEPHKDVYIDSRYGWPEAVRDDPKKLATLMRRERIDPATTQCLVVGANRSHDDGCVSTNDKLFVWVNADAGDIEADLLKKFGSFRAEQVLKIHES